jgi:hypothetical protein
MPVPHAVMTVPFWTALAPQTRVQASLVFPVSLAMPAAQVLLPERALAELEPVPRAAVTVSFWTA